MRRERLRSEVNEVRRDLAHLRGFLESAQLQHPQQALYNLRPLVAEDATPSAVIAKDSPVDVATTPLSVASKPQPPASRRTEPKVLFHRGFFLPACACSFHYYRLPQLPLPLPSHDLALLEAPSEYCSSFICHPCSPVTLAVAQKLDHSHIVVAVTTASSRILSCFRSCQ